MKYLLICCSEDGDVSVNLHDEIPDLEGACIHDGPALLKEKGSDPQYWGTSGYVVFEVLTRPVQPPVDLAKLPTWYGGDAKA